MQVLGLFFAFILRAVSSSGRRDYDSDEDYMVPRSAPRQPAANRQPNQANPASGSGGAAPEARPPRTDAWSTRMREKVGSCYYYMKFASMCRNFKSLLFLLSECCCLV